jgi:hypothetical protein
MTYRAELFQRLHEYCRAKGLMLGKQLGFGVHGIVFVAENNRKGDRPSRSMSGKLTMDGNVISICA